MKNLILISGTMGVGKTSTSLMLKEKLNNSVFLDGDWCWDMKPFIVNNETKNMVLDNISYMLNNFLKISHIENIIFCWVMDEEKIINDILQRIENKNYKLYKFSLIPNKEALTKRINLDIEKGIRKFEDIEKSIKRIEKYKNMNTVKIEVSNLTKEEVANKIVEKMKDLEEINMNIKEEIFKCEICGSEMIKNEYAYDNNQYGKVYYKCNECGHKMNIIK